VPKHFSYGVDLCAAGPCPSCLQFKKARAFCLQLGHNNDSYADPHFRIKLGHYTYGGDEVSIDGLVFCAPTIDDAQRTHELIVRCDIQDYGEPDTDLSDLTFDWDRIDLPRDAWLVATPTGDLVGYGAVIRWRTELEYAAVWNSVPYYAL
jgi:hypothetical protein